MRPDFPKYAASGLIRRNLALALPLLAIVLFCLIPPAAIAQTTPEECSAGLGTISLIPDEGPAGSSFSVVGSFIIIPRVQGLDDAVPSVILPGPDFEVWWLESGLSDATMLGTMPSEWDDETNLASFSGSFAVPAPSAPGPHQVAIVIAGSGSTACEYFTVTTNVQQDAYAQTATSLPTTLPGTGFMMIAPLTGFLALAAGGFAIRNRSDW